MEGSPFSNLISETRIGPTKTHERISIEMSACATSSSRCNQVRGAGAGFNLLQTVHGGGKTDAQPVA